MKSQVYLIQYILFFIIGLSFFSIVLSFLSTVIASSSVITIDWQAKSIANNLLVNVVDLVFSCVYCNVSTSYVYLPHRIQESLYEINLDNLDTNNQNFYLNIQNYGKLFSVNVNNLNYTYNFSIIITPYILPTISIKYYSNNKTIIS